MGETNKLVCVTGASGYIASWLTKLLLERGYTVRGTVRNLSDPDKVAHLKAFEGAEDRLHLYEANLVDEGSFDSIVDGCDAVFHTASPVLRSVTNPEEELLKPAVEGTLNVLKSCNRSVTRINRVVVTSSVATLTINHRPQGPDAIVDETWFSDPKLCRETKRWYWLAKTLAEEEAVKFAGQNGMDLVVINPGFVIGPLLQPNLNASLYFILELIEGKGRLPDYQFIDVRDVAYAHIMAYENPSAHGRYFLAASSMSQYEASHALHELCPSLNIPLDKYDAGKQTFKVSRTKAETLGLKFIPLLMSLKDTIESLKEKNFLKI